MNLTIFSTLSEPNRLHILELLRNGPKSVNEIAGQLKLNQPQTSKHLKVLSNAGMVKVYPVAQKRIYKLSPKPFEELDEWLKEYRHIWENRFDKLDKLLQKEVKKHGRST